MKAILHTQYGPPSLLKYGETDKPQPKKNEVLVKVYATSVTTGDCNVRNQTFAPNLFKPLARLTFGVFKPRKPALGMEFAGVIEETGKNVVNFKKGDEVFGMTGMKLGAHAEYVCVNQSGMIAKKPSNLSFQEAAVIPFGAHTAYYYLKDLGKINKGMKVLIYGASGSIGTYAVQLAKHFGSEVHGVCSGKNAEMVKSLGADGVIDYTKEDYTKNGEIYDIVFDTVGKTSFCDSRKSSIKDGGVFLPTVIDLRELAQMMLTPLFFRKKVKAGVAAERQKDLIFLKELAEAGKLKVIIDREYTLEQIPQAFEYVEKGHKKGNVVVSVV